MGDQHSVLVMEQAICCSLVILNYNLEPCKLNLEDTEIKFIEIEIIQKHEQVANCTRKLFCLQPKGFATFYELDL